MAIKHVIDGKVTNGVWLGTKTFFVLPRSEAKDFTNATPWAAISIVGIEDWPTLSEENRRGLLKLSFPDWDLPRVGWEAQMFNEKMANQVLAFTESVWHEVDTFMIHCVAGMSRSPAIAAAIAKIKLGNDASFFEHHTPNMLVYKKMLETKGLDQ